MKKMMRKDVPEHDIKLFTWMKTMGTWHGATDVSDLKGSGLVWSRVYDDACDVGFLVLGITGVRKLFTLVSEKRGADGDVESWHFTGNDGLWITVFND